MSRKDKKARRTTDNPDFSSLFSMKAGRFNLRILPLWSIRYLFFSFLVILAFLALLEYGVIPFEETRGELVLLTQEQEQIWRAENSRINENNVKKVIADPANYLWISRGFQIPFEKTKRRRVLVMGDSFIWGDGIANFNDLWWRQLQRELVRRGYHHVEVISAGFPGAATRDQLSLARNIIENYEIDLIIWGYVTNDADEHVVKRFNYTPEEKERFNTEIGPDSFVNFLIGIAGLPFPQITSKLQALREEKRFLLACDSKTGYPGRAWERMLLEGKNIRKYRRTLKKLAKFHVQKRIPYFFITLPAQPDYARYAPLHTGVESVFREVGIAFHDILDDFVRTYPNKNDPLCMANPVNGHPGIKSTNFYAVKAADILEKDFPKYIGPRRSTKVRQKIIVSDWTPYFLNLESPAEGAIEFTYPATTNLMLTQPIGEPFVQLNFSMPIPVARIRLQGRALERTSLYLTAEDPELGYDDGTIHALGEQEGDSVTWLLRGSAFSNSVNTLRIEAHFGDESERRLKLTVMPKKRKR